MNKENKINEAFNKAINKDAINKLDLKTLKKLDKILSKIKY